MKDHLKLTSIIIGIVLVIGLCGAAAWYSSNTLRSFFGGRPTQQTTSQTPQVAPPTTKITSQSDGVLTIFVPESFGFATTKDQITVKSYIPPCDDNFLYCIYYNGDAFKGTNFESAGLSITKLAKLTTKKTCLETPPTGYTKIPEPVLYTSKDTYDTAMFSVSDGAAGHTASGRVYRLFVPSVSTCYELQTRVAKSQYGNYPAGSIQEFTDAYELSAKAMLRGLVDTVVVQQAQVQFPSAN
ncbi:MAG: hypothetical protein QG621_346 [Patescibacteria group bacterium]|jgi:hypothetical protein|nr:hypothetical protein [Patescibacteria group bacterium]